jgi:hypothetical protein
MNRADVQRQRSDVPPNGDSVDARRLRSLTILPDEPLIGLPLPDEAGNVTFHYFADEAAAEEAARPYRVSNPSELAGIWSHFDWDEMERELDRIRHESVPTPPIDDV